MERSCDLLAADETLKSAIEGDAVEVGELGAIDVSDEVGDDEELDDVSNEDADEIDDDWCCRDFWCCWCWCCATALASSTTEWLSSAAAVVVIDVEPIAAHAMSPAFALAPWMRQTRIVPFYLAIV